MCKCNFLIDLHLQPATCWRLGGFWRHFKFSYFRQEVLHPSFMHLSLMFMFQQHCKTVIWCTIYVISLSLRNKCPLKGTKRQLWILYVYFIVVPSVWASLLSADFIASLIGFPLLSASFFFCTASWLTLPWIIWFGYSTSQDKLLIMMIADIGLLIIVSHCCGWVTSWQTEELI